MVLDAGGPNPFHAGYEFDRLQPSQTSLSTFRERADGLGCG